MKILYFAYLGNLNYVGVLKKLINQVEMLHNQHVSIKGFFLYTSRKSTCKLHKYSNIQLVRVHGQANEKETLKLIDRIIKKEKDVDFIYFRYPFSSWHLLRLVKKYLGKFIFEHQTKELDEIKLFQKERKEFWSQYIQELLFAPLVLRHAKAVIGVTDEIAMYEKKRALGNKLVTKTIGNGIDVDSIPLRNPPLYDGTELSLIFVSGYPSPWHGVDRIIRGIANYSGSVNINLYIIGPVVPEVKSLVNKLRVKKNVLFLGCQYGEELDRWFDICHIAVGCLGVHRKKMNQATALKTREYIARGIPFILSEQDIDLINKKDISPYYLKVQTNDEAINIEKVLKFADKVLHINKHNMNMREFAKQNLDMSVKMKELKDFFMTLLSRKL